MKKVIVALIVICILSVGWYYIFPAFVTREIHEKTPITLVELENGLKKESLGIISKVPFESSAHEVKGSASLIEDVDGGVHIRFENFEIINGPDVRVYVATDLDKTDAIELGPLKATHGEFNYDVPGDINLELYSKVLVWCEDFNILFAYADFKR